MAAKPEKPVEEELVQKLKELPVKDRFKAVALNSVHKELRRLDEELQKEIRKLQFKYEQQMAPLHERSNDLIQGKGLPKDEELNEAATFFSQEELATKETNNVHEPIADFWLKALKNCPVVREEIQAKDEPALKTLQRVVIRTKEDAEDYELDFVFGANDFFTNEVLTKKVIFEEGQPARTEGTQIAWKEGKNLSKKTVTKKQKNKKSGQTRTVTKEVDDDTFFLFFNDSKPAEGEDEDDDEEAELPQGHRFEIDNDIAELIKEDLVPYSLDYFLGLVEDEGFDDEGMEDIDEEDDEEDEAPKPRKKSKGQQGGGKGAGGAGGEQKPECKQQ
eukprot:TRINITY_DN71_c0_g2_i1.p1 TRINITY_DN71_c0_g2~~TRINITY_DN71_c0_g2_i1.p1  ORF type:complete len:332 (+),score=164.05 TRINITY_DN71_c0_g2_i1:169-1164(+)